MAKELENRYPATLHARDRRSRTDRLVFSAAATLRAWQG